MLVAPYDPVKRRSLPLRPTARTTCSPVCQKRKPASAIPAKRRNERRSTQNVNGRGNDLMYAMACETTRGISRTLT